MNLFATEVGRNLPPFFCFPFDNGRLDDVRFQPLLGTGNDCEERFCL